MRPHDPFSEGPQCGGCRVILEDNWYNRVHNETDGMSEQERFQLTETQNDLQANTRLACCVPIESWMNGMTLRVDPEPTEGSLAELQ
jgi:ferredoxin